MATAGFHMENLKKTPTGISGLDELTGGGLPAGRPTLVCGGAGCGKTLLATTFLVSGALGVIALVLFARGALQRAATSRAAASSRWPSLAPSRSGTGPWPLSR